MWAGSSPNNWSRCHRSNKSTPKKFRKPGRLRTKRKKKGLKNVGATPGYGLVHPEAQRKITEIQKVIEERYIVLKRKRQALSQILTRLSPVGVYVHAVSEVTAGVSIEECRDLVSAVRSSKAKYMMAENYTYMKPNVLVGELVKRGLFGDIYYAEGAYIHELKGLNERTPWRRRWQTGVNGSTYSTHSLGPVLQWFAGQRVVAVCTVGCGHHYRDARNELYEMEDSVTMMCRLSGGGLAHIPRGHALGPAAQHGALRPAGHRRVLRIHRWVPGRPQSLAEQSQWEPLEELEELLPDYWKNPPEAALRAGHGGGDYWEVQDFVHAIIENREPPIGIDQAMDMTLPGLVSQQSIAQGATWVAVPDSRNWT